ncbi:hypothetical protein RO3G_17281 [Rhizopus delemar RA 99-880]|uniref:Uncharacterized protein n=1 Tax=Rhizopus delemar (strain RA 99-880 / ATCC MYA-4621 / FGSC 9543 / NRRL 43880) TaxID=246409 RepID=I1CVU0_RHIO9|nr:hypothetical protein RO3G_17281 [Rhizopus delemar RA 99-880]|eukprot:EIE92570.1 hypothetical protein RO3G_17281 [Rhizopus delemar RA 99-880]
MLACFSQVSFTRAGIANQGPLVSLLTTVLEDATGDQGDEEPFIFISDEDSNSESDGNDTSAPTTPNTSVRSSLAPLQPSKTMDDEKKKSHATHGYNSEISTHGYKSEVSARGHNSEINARGYNSEISARGHNSEISARGHNSEISARGHNSEVNTHGYSSELVFVLSSAVSSQSVTTP